MLGLNKNACLFYFIQLLLPMSFVLLSAYIQLFHLFYFNIVFFTLYFPFHFPIIIISIYFYFPSSSALNPVDFQLLYEIQQKVSQLVVTLCSPVEIMTSIY